MHVGKYSIAKFIDDARLILKTGDALEAKKSAIGERMVELSRRDDLLRTGFMLGPNDTTPHNWMLWQEPGMSLHVAGLFPGHTSAVHEHGDFWAVGCGYRGCDRWDMYQRFDDGSQPGYADVRMVDQYEVSPGKAVWMPPPPRAIHSHNNASATEFSYELLFFAADSPPPPEERLIYDIDEKKCWPSPYNFRPVFTGEYYPPRPVARRGLFSGLEGLWQGAKVAAGGVGRAMFCPVCHSLSAR